MNDRNRLSAVALSLACTGLGHVYCQRLRRGIALFLLSLSFAPVALLLSEAPPSRMVLVALVASALAIVGLYVFAVADAWRIAGRSPDGEAPVVRWGWLYALFILVGAFYPLATAVVIRNDVIEVYRMAGASMAPTLRAEDRILVNKRAFRGRAPRRGDVVAFRAPGRPDRVWVKRVVGLPGDTVAMRAGRVVVNGQVLAGAKGVEEIDGRRYEVRPPSTAGDFAEVEVPATACFVLGDQRDVSRDSRHFRAVPLRDLIGEAQYVLVPAGGWHRFGVCR